MKRTKNPDDRFEWDMTIVFLLVLVVAFIVLFAEAIGPIGHLR